MIQRIAFTPGEPAGIGPDLAVLLAQQQNNHEIIAFADPVLLQQRAAQLQLPLHIRTFDPKKPTQGLQKGELCVVPITLKTTCEPGQLNTDNAAYVLNCLDVAISHCQQKICSALVTGPVHKGIINDARPENSGQKEFFSGHTEYLAQRTNTNRVVMMLATDKLRVALVTTHIPLADVAKNITQNSLQETITILHQALKKNFSLPNPRILVCGLNPHAGEGGHLGKEEIEVIEPVLNRLRKENIELIGPLPADTLFTEKILQKGDAVLAMYHDQGLPVLKHRGFGHAVNITLGLPIIRTSVDHGTALDLAGKGTADMGSLSTALQYAVKMANSEPTIK